jgi:hypothetical protein
MTTMTAAAAEAVEAVEAMGVGVDVLALASAAALAPNAPPPISTALAQPVHMAVVVEEVVAAAAVILTIQMRKRNAPREPLPINGSLVTPSGHRIARRTLLRSPANAQLQARQRRPQVEAAQRKFRA